MSEELRAREWRVNPSTPSVIMTPHGRISIGWSNQRAGEAIEYSLAEETAAMIVRLVNASFASSAAGQREGWEKARDALEVVAGGDLDVSGTAIIVGNGAAAVMRQVRDALEAIASPSAPEERRDEVERLREALKIATDTLKLYASPIGHFNALGELYSEDDEFHPGGLAQTALTKIAALTPVPGGR